jgi:hypothetical protein
MQRVLADLSFEDCEAWMRELGYVDDGKPDWARLKRESGVGTHKDVIKQRWSTGAPKVRRQILDALRAAENKRKTPTMTGARVVGLDRWNEIGAKLAHEPSLFAEWIGKLSPIAESIDSARVLEAQAAEQRARAQLAMEAFTSPVPIGKDDRRPRASGSSSQAAVTPSTPDKSPTKIRPSR